MACKAPRVGSAPILLSAALAILLPGAAGHAADPADEDWPCQQRKVPEISAGMVWAGPPLGDVGDSWRGDPLVAEFARKIAARRRALDDARTLIDQFAADAGADKNRRLAMLVAGSLSIINDDRSPIIAGIGRYTRRQRDLARKIERQAAELGTLPANGTTAQSARRDELQEMQAWDIRILQERERSLTYVCEQPVLLERRIFAIGREIARRLDP